MAGFFSCAGEIWSKSPSFELTLPTVDTDNEEITPITEDEKSDEEDIKIIDKRLFVYSLKPKRSKSSQPWFASLKDKTTKSITKSIAPQYSTSNNHGHLSHYDKRLESSDEVNASMTARCPENDAHICKVNLSEGREDQENGLSALDEFEEPESQSILQNNSLDSRKRHDHFYDTNMLPSTSIKCGNNTFENEDENLNRVMSHESVYLFEDYITNNPPPHRSKAKTPRQANREQEKKTDNKEKPKTCNLEKGQYLHEDTEDFSCPAVEEHGTPQNKKRKRHKKNKGDLENMEKEQNETPKDKEIQGDGQLNNVTSEVKTSEKKEGRKHKKKRKKTNDCDENVLEPLPLQNIVKSSPLGLVESQEHSEVGLANIDNGGTDCKTTQHDESVSVRKKKKKKVSLVAETMENAIHLSVSGEDHGISTNETESAETNKHLQDAQLGNKAKKKKKKRRADGEFDKIDSNEINDPINEPSKNKDCDISEVNQPPSDDNDHLKKKKKKASKKLYLKE
ncbi:hypothetical protein WMY93_011627 [Mugilogobius chulae]|uniref:Uncharacterized protein n=1 Tax=Mugilogobius chulae TaxID=88201 RepID=A0AAW0P6D1_9GOBI